MDIITKIGELKTPATNRILKYFTELNYNETEQFSRCCELVYYNDEFELDPNVVNTAKNINMSFISSYNNGVLLEDVKEAIKELTENFKIKYLWIMAYTPKDRLSFHADNFANRHSLTFNFNERFYNYEFMDDLNPGSHIHEFNENFDSAGETLDGFNKYFIAHHKNCKITVLKPLSIYTFGETIHAFANDTEDKVRFNFIFEIQE